MALGPYPRGSPRVRCIRRQIHTLELTLDGIAVAGRGGVNRGVLALGFALALLACADTGPEPPARERHALVKGPGANVQFFAYPPQKNKQDPGTWGPLLTDIENHLPASYGSQYYDSNPAIHAHETTHGINAHLRNTYGVPGDNAFYVLKDRAILLAEPKMTKSKVAAFVPSQLRGSRFNLYIIGQTAWDNEPLYVFDEWVSYTNDSDVGVELHNSGKWTYGWTDGVAGTLEFCVYATATAMAIEQHDPGYLTQTPQFLEFLAWHLQRGMDIFRAGKDLQYFKWSTQDTYYNDLQSSTAAAPLRTFLTQRFGEPFMKQVLGLAPAPPPTPDAGPPPGQFDAGPPPGQLDSGLPGPPSETGPGPQLDGLVPSADAGPGAREGGVVIPPRLGPRPGQAPVLVGGCALGRPAGVDLGALWLLAALLLVRCGRRRSRR